MELNRLSVIDWNSILKITGNKQNLAEEMLNMFCQSLPNDMHVIQALYKKNNRSLLLSQIHRLHGATCYCGVPRLKNILAKIELCLKADLEVDISNLFQQLLIEVDLLHAARETLKQHLARLHQ